MSLEALERELPPATLLLGPDPDLMLRAASWAVRKHCVYSADRVLIRWLSAADARNMVRFAATAPFGPFKAAIIVTDAASEQAQNILLKILEEPPPTIRFILIATRSPLPTVVSRCQVITVPAAGGEQEPDGKVAGEVTAVLNAALSGDLAGLDAALAGWGDVHHSVLCVLLAERAAAGRGVPGLSQAQARRLLGALGRYAGAHPRLAAHAAFVTVLSDKENYA